MNVNNLPTNFRRKGEAPFSSGKNRLKSDVFLCLLSSVICLLFAGFLLACTPSPVRQQLNRAEETMETDFRAASTLLDSIDSSSLRGEEQAIYAILRFQTDYKADKHITDSLPLIATHYYGIPHRKNYHAAMAWYSLGCYYSMVPTDSLAINAYLNALDLFPDSTCRYYRLSLQNLGLFYLSKNMLDRAMTCFKHYYNLAEKANNARDMNLANYYLGDTEMKEMKNFPKADSLFVEVLKSPPSDIVEWRSTLNRAKIKIFYDRDYEAALELIDQYRKLMNNDKFFGGGYAYMGMCYQNLNQLDSAFYYFDKARISRNIYGQYNTYRGLTEVSLLKKGETEIYDYFDKFRSVVDSILNDRDTQNISSLSIAHELENRKKEYKSNLLTLGIALLLLLVIALLVADSRRKKMKLKYDQQLNDIKQRYIRQNINEEDTDSDVSPHPSSLSLQQERIALYRQRYARSPWVHYFHVHQPDIKDRKYMSQEDVEKFRPFLNSLFVDLFVDMIKENGTLNSPDLEFCAMTLLGFKAEQIAYYTHSSPQYSYNRHYRLKEKLTPDWYQFIFAKSAE
ncbi:MAG: hypothetical protein IK000_04490 [Bacteroidaceae bacterium]|nr:hypothetical protein [Bacteroidaceae bacterium]